MLRKCGIIGGIGTNIYSFIELGLPELKKRGPDHQSYLALSNRLVMGASRLAMTDLHPRSNQPMVDLENKNVIVFNGEIYNYVKLKKRLLSSGIKFTTESDTEVLLKLLSIYGTKIIPELEGMFSFVFFDYKKKI
jgi:asparagine synthase (glutamine-hydrolysing)